jgi:hypothetical protein
MILLKKKQAMLGLRQFVPGEKRCYLCRKKEEENIDQAGNHHFFEVGFKDNNFNNQHPSNLIWKCLSC